ncbi:MAG TPA: MEDS domain-containing protein, partial [Nitrososphaeraceae archaeon]|nr:MEDS domain-containing protein [Nitrososphaeraceae archaeon]
MDKKKEDQELDDKTSVNIKNNNTNIDEILNNKDKTILLITDHIQDYQQQFNDYNINDYKISFANWTNILNITNYSNDENRYNHFLPEFVIADFSTLTVEDANRQISTNTNIINKIEDIKKTLPKKRIFLILSSESMIKSFLSMGICKNEDVKLQPFSGFDLVDFISINNQKERLERLHLHDHCMNTYSSSDTKIKNAIKFLEIGIKNNESTLILLDNDINLFDFETQIELHNMDVNNLQKEGLLKIYYSEDWYLTFNRKNNTKNNNIATIDSEQIYKKFYNLVDQVTKIEGKNGLRIFGMMDCFFEYGLVDEIVDYDCMM